MIPILCRPSTPRPPMWPPADEVLEPHLAPHPQSSADGLRLLAGDAAPPHDPERVAADAVPAARWAEVGR